MILPTELCEVCQRFPATQTKQSTLGNFSFAICDGCANVRAEPKLFVYAAIEQYGHWRKVPKSMSLVYFARRYYNARGRCHEVADAQN